MATMPDIKIQLDEEALKEQMRGALREIFDEFSIKLRMAADNLNPQFLDDQGKWLREAEEQAYQRGIEVGKSQAVSDGPA